MKYLPMEFLQRHMAVLLGYLFSKNQRAVMGKKKPLHKNFKHEGGFVGLPRRVFKSTEYRALSCVARCLLDELQHKHVGHNNGRIFFSVGNGMKNLNLSYNTVKNAFNELQKCGFIERSLDADYTNGQAREWRLTYEPCCGREPTDEWRS